MHSIDTLSTYFLDIEAGGLLSVALPQANGLYFAQLTVDGEVLPTMKIRRF